MKNISKIAINLGCGNHVAEGWVNIDNSPNARLSKFPRLKWLLWKMGLISDFHYKIVWPKDLIIRNLERKLPYANETVDYVYSSHFFEHLSKESSFKLMSDVFRVLKTDGIFRIVLPDLKLQINKYIEQSNDPEFKYKAADIFIEELMMVKKARDPHLWMYDLPSIINKLQSIGFKHVYSCKFKEGKCIDIDILDNRLEFSLWVEAIK